MHHEINLLDQIALVQNHVVTDDSILTSEGAYATAFGLVCEGGSGYQLPDADAYAKRLAEEAEAFLELARHRSNMKDETLVRKALHSVAFSLRWRTNHLCVPTKLVGTSQHQPALWAMVRSNVGFGTLLDVEEVADGESKGKRFRLVVSFEGEELSDVQPKWVPVLRPLLRFGAEVRLIRVTGEESTFTLGCNIMMALNDSVAALNHALGTDVGGDGYGSDGASQAPMEAAPVEAQPRPDHGGDGAAGGLRLVTPAAAPTATPIAMPTANPLDVVLYRDINGTARATVNHVVRHSPTGIEWGYHGSGPADLARSILLRVTDDDSAERHYQAFKAEVVALVPKGGGVIRPADVRAWLAGRGHDRP